jgi:hypothetical protein
MDQEARKKLNILRPPYITKQKRCQNKEERNKEKEENIML